MEGAYGSCKGGVVYFENGRSDSKPSQVPLGRHADGVLGHMVWEGLMAIPQHRVQALAKYTKPTSKKGLCSFLGAVGFYQRYVKQLAKETSILTPLTSKLAPVRIAWTSEGELAFHEICKQISMSCELCIPLPPL